MNAKLDNAVNLVKRGYKISIVAKEAGIDEESLRQSVIDFDKKSFRDAIELDPDSVDFSARKMDDLINRYYSRYRVSKKEDIVKKQRIFDDKKLKQIDEYIGQCRDILESIRQKPFSERKNGAMRIYRIIRAIKQEDASSEQLASLNILLSDEVLLNIKVKDIKLDFERRRVARELVKRYDEEAAGEVSYEKLKEISSRFTPSLIKNGGFYADGIRYKIANLMHTQKHKDNMSSIKNNLPIALDILLKKVADGSIENEEIEDLLNMATKQRAESAPSTQLSFDLERHKKQVIVQARMVLEERAESYPISDAKRAIEVLTRIIANESQALRSVVKNLIAQRKYTEAKLLCENYIAENRRGYDEERIPMQGVASDLLNDVKAAEIGEIVLRGINASGSKEEKAKYYKTIKAGLKVLRIKPERVSLGKNENGRVHITLSDIWQEEVQR